MKQGIIIVSSQVTRHWLIECISRINQFNIKYPILIHTNYPDNNEFEMGGIKLGMKEFDEFFLMHDTLMIKDPRVFDLCFDLPGVSVSLGRTYFMYLGKYLTSILQTLELPEVRKKNDAIMQEMVFNDNYRKAAGENYVELMLDTVKDGPVREMRYGRENLIIENEFIKKYKGYWKGFVDE